MTTLLGMLLASAALSDGGDVEALEQLWSGVRDSSEQVVVNSEPGSETWPQLNERRVRTIVAPVEIPWLGRHILYLEEFLEDDPGHPRRQLLLQLQPAPDAGHAVHVHLLSFADPRQWTHLNYRPALAASLVWRDVRCPPRAAISRCCARASSFAAARSVTSAWMRAPARCAIWTTSC